MAGGLQALGTVLAAIVGLLLWRLQSRHARREDERRRTEQVRGMLVALLAEIDVNIERLAKSYAPDWVDAHLRDLRAAVHDTPGPTGDTRMPVAPADATNFVFDDLKKELRLLPDGVIDAAVRYYRYDIMLAAVTQAFSSGLYNGLAEERREKALLHSVDLGELTLIHGLRAKKAIAAHLQGAEPEARTEGVWRERDARTLAEALDRRDDRSGHGDSPMAAAEDKAPGGHGQ